MKLSQKGLVFLLLVPFYGFTEPGPYFRFIENKNQWPLSIDFGTRIPGGNMSVSAGRLTYTFLDFQKIEEFHESGHHDFQEVKASSQRGRIIDGHTIDVNFIGSNRWVKPESFERLSTNFNFFVGKDPARWASNISAFNGIFYRSIYSGIDLKIYSQGQSLKYDFIITPGADPSLITTDYSGAKELYLDRGDLIVKTSLGDLIEKKPVAYQLINGNLVYVKCEYTLCENQLSFSFPDGYDQCYELVIDPLLIFSTYSGSTADSWGSTATPGESGNLYSAGVTNRFVGNTFSGDFPVTSGAFQTTYGGLYDVGILKYDSTGQHLLYASYLGGSDNESAHSLVMNANQELIVLGTTGSSDFPTSSNAFSRIFKGGTAETNVVNYDQGTDLFVARISKDGSQLINSTYLGGSANDGLNPTHGALSANYGDELRGDVITDQQGNVYISSVTSSNDFPVINGFNTTFKGGDTDALLLKLDPSLTSILWGSFMGGAASDASHTIKFDKANDLYVAGGTASSDFPVTASTYQSVFGGSADGWIAKITNDGSTILASTFTGTAAFNQVYFLDLNKNDDVYVYGQTVGTFPITTGAYHNANSGQFVQKFNSDLNQLIFSTVFGSGSGIPDISPTAFIVNDCNNIFMTGWGGIVNQFEGYWNNNTVGMPVTSDAFQKTTSGSDFYFMVLTDDAKEFLYGTYMGGKSSRTHVDGGTSRFDKKGVVYHAVCSGCAAFNATGRPTSDFPVTANAWSTKNKSLNCNNAAFKFDLSSLRARIQTNSVALNMPGLNKVCFPDSIVFQNRSTGGEIYEWDFGDDTQTVVTDTAGIVHQYKKAGKYTVKMKAIDAGTCVGKDSTYTVVTVFERLGVAGPDGTMCTGSSFKLTASNGIAYSWIGIKNDFKSTAQNPGVSPEVESNYEITITDFQGCIIKDTVNVKVVPGIDLQLDWNRKFNCYARPELVVTNKTDEKEETFWDFGDGTTSDLRNDTHGYQKDGLYSVRLVGKKDFCVYDTLVKVPVFTFFTPNVITPEQSSGKNDTFQVLYGDRTPAEMNIIVTMVVYNRWGDKVFESFKYENDWSGNELANGVYYYEATVENETTCKGWVQIIR